jgi:hypothetical protein
MANFTDIEGWVRITLYNSNPINPTSILAAKSELQEGHGVDSKPAYSPQAATPLTLQ